jgi:hypothetical protein
MMQEANGSAREISRINLSRIGSGTKFMKSLRNKFPRRGYLELFVLFHSDVEMNCLYTNSDFLHTNIFLTRRLCCCGCY